MASGFFFYNKAILFTPCQYILLFVTVIKCIAYTIFNSHPVKARDMKFLYHTHHPLFYPVLHVRCHKSECHISLVMCHMSVVKCI